MKKLTILLGCLLFILCGCVSEDPNRRTLKIGTNSGYPPYEIKDKNGNLTGFDIELMDEISKVTGLKFEWVDMDFSALIGAVQSGKIDLIVAGFTPDPQRAKVLDFTDYYLSAQSDIENYIMVRKDSDIKTIEDIKNKKVVVQMSTVQAAAVEEIKDEYNLNVDTRLNYVDMVLEVKLKRADFVVMEKAVCEQYMEVYKDFRLIKMDVGSNSSGNVIAFKKGSPYHKEINDALKVLKENGKLDELIKNGLNKYH